MICIADQTEGMVRAKAACPALPSLLFCLCLISFISSSYYLLILLVSSRLGDNNTYMIRVPFVSMHTRDATHVIPLTRLTVGSAVFYNTVRLFFAASSLSRVKGFPFTCSPTFPIHIGICTLPSLSYTWCRLQGAPQEA